jgi:hypothetical protein
MMLIDLIPFGGVVADWKAVSIFIGFNRAYLRPEALGREHIK